MEIISEYFVAVIMAICLGVGYIVKHSLDFIPDKFIPLIVGTLGILLNVWINGWALSPQILLGGLASGLASTGAYEVQAQLRKRE
jgi:hypothetical protein